MINRNEYATEVKRGLAELLENRKKSNTRDERAVQDFITKYPPSILAALDGVESQYQLLADLVISQPRIMSLDGNRTPDFLVVTRNSLNLYFNFIEIEDPSKKVFASSALEPSSHFTQALNQLHQWNAFRKNEIENYCEDLLHSVFSENFNNRPTHIKHYNYILVYGFSDEIISLGGRYNALLQQYFNSSNFKHITYSRLLSQMRFEFPMYSVVKEAETNRYRAINLSPSKRYKEDEWSQFHNIIGKEDVISSSLYFSDDEKKDLIAKINSLDSKSTKEIIDLTKMNMGTDVFEDLEDII